MKSISIEAEQTAERLVLQYSGLILSICYSMTGDYFEAEDLAQETFAAACRNYAGFDGANEKAWLTRIAANKCRDYLKSAARRIRPAPEAEFAEIQDPRLSPEEETMDAEAKRRMKALCGELKEPYRTVANAYFMEHESPEEIAGRLEKNINTIYTQIHRVRGMLRNRWKEVFG